jgi:septal ring factor EnvC (AmiA/AmiB activator)
MPVGFGRTTRKLTHVGLTLAPARRRGRWLIAVALLAAALAAGGAIGYLLAERPAPAVAPPRAASPAPELAAVRQQLDEARMALRVADARSQELERQIDALNQKLTESQDQLTFFKKAREGKR